MLSSVEEVAAALERERYVADRGLAVTLFLALRLGKPLFVEGEAGGGKTEKAKAPPPPPPRPLIPPPRRAGLRVAPPAPDRGAPRRSTPIPPAPGGGRARE